MIETRAKVYFDKPLYNFSEDKNYITLILSDFWINSVDLRNYTFKEEPRAIFFHVDERCDISAEEFLSLVGHSRVEAQKIIKKRNNSFTDENIEEWFLYHYNTREFYDQLERKNNSIKKVTLINIELC
jgi:hypothetical protein